jgi:crotonobetainyl-CoA:carnitine CoA-transferase CaiB-like acyl-CoA transferase
MLERLVPPIARFLMHHTKQELFEGAVARRILLFPVATPADIRENPQLQARRYWEDVAHPDLPAPVTFPGPFVDASVTPLRRRRLAPKLGEHNTEIYVDELGLTPAELGRLQRIGAI